MVDVDIAPEGTAEGAAPAEVGGSQVGDDALQALETAPQETVSPEVQSWLEKNTDPTKWPEGIRKKLVPELEKPFLSNYTRKANELAAKERAVEERTNKLLEYAARTMEAKGSPPTPSQMDVLKEKIQSGDFEAVPQLVEAMLSERVTPALNQVKLKGMFDEAHQEFPILKEPEVAATVNRMFQENPELVQMARANDFQGTKWILRGLAVDAQLQRANVELKALKETSLGRDKLIAEKAVADYKAGVLRTPTTTSRAGTSPRGETEKEFKSFREAAEEALLEQLGR